MATDNEEDIADLHSKTVCEFLLLVFDMGIESATKSLASSRSVLQQIGVQRYAIGYFKLYNNWYWVKFKVLVANYIYIHDSQKLTSHVQCMVQYTICYAQLIMLKDLHTECAFWMVTWHPGCINRPHVNLSISVLKKVLSSSLTMLTDRTELCI